MSAGINAEGGLFKKTYEPHGMEGLLRPLSRTHDSRYGRLYDVFYGYDRPRITNVAERSSTERRNASPSTGEASSH